jgi:hypothetical protein
VLDLQAFGLQRLLYARPGRDARWESCERGPLREIELTAFTQFATVNI